MSMKMVCNRCNKVKEDKERFSHVNFTYLNDNNLSESYDLCPECAKQFGIFIDGGTVEEDHYKDSKPCTVVIHKLANGNYAIENAPDSEDDRTCHSCEYHLRECNLEPCKSCNWYSNWIPKNDESEKDLEDEDHAKVTREVYERIENALFVDKVADAVSDNPDDPCPCYAKHCSSPESCCGCGDYDKWKERQK